VEEALRRGLIDEEKSKRWIEKFEAGVSTWHEFKLNVAVAGSGALYVDFQSTDPERIEKLKQKLESLGLGEGEHFVATWRGGNRCYLYIKKEGIIELAHIAKHGAYET